MKMEFQLAAPFLPFEQLLGVLPAASKSLLPPCFQGLMTSPESPIIEYYPLEFEQVRANSHYLHIF
jgi:5'-3' exoribonuclease 1